MAYGGSDKYYNPANKVVYDGDTARADDLNSVNYAVDAAFEQVANDLDGMISVFDTKIDLARKWAEELEDVVVEDGGYSAYHWSRKAAAYIGSIDAAYILSKLLTVDGSGSGVDADMLDGVHGSAYAQLNSPALTGTPTAPTAAADTSTTQLATTAFVTGQASTSDPVMDGVASAGSGYKFARSNHVHPSDTSKASLNSPAFTGTPTAPTATADTNTTQVASTAFVLGQLSSSNPVMNGTASAGTSTKGSRSDHVHPSDTSKASLNSPALTGTPTAPTASQDTNTTQLATTAFVIGQGSTSNPVMDGTASAGTSTQLSKADHVHPSDTSKASLNSPSFTGTPTVPTPAVGDNSTKAASTAFVANAITNKVDKTSATGTAVLPSGTTAQRETSGGVGIRYNTETNLFEGYTGSAWGSFLGAGADIVAPQITFSDNSVQKTAGFNSYRNKIINGCFRVWQRGTTQTTNTYNSDDRWFNGNLGSTKVASRQEFTLGQTTVPGNPKYFSRTVVSSVASNGNYCVKQQRIEGVDTLSGKTITLSFWAKADANKYIAIDFSQNFGTGGSPSATINAIGAHKFLLSTSWVRYTATISIPSVSGKTLGSNNNSFLELTFWFDAGSDFNLRTSALGQQSGTFDLYGVQVEEGSSASTFEARSKTEEELMCFRYCEVLTAAVAGSVGTSVLFGDCIGHSVKRSSPSYYVMSVSENVNVVSIYFTGYGPDYASTRIWGNASANGSYTYTAMVSIDAEI